ncbi:MAG: redox-regulated ATPase YchF [Candidatus Micrarchaeota archaeon]
MGLKVGMLGKPSSGKSTFFSGATLVDVPIAAYPFTTIKPNIGVTYATYECPCKGLKVKCSPQNSKCENGLRLIPVTAVDVAGLVQGAHEGKGMGNQFLSDLTDADGLIHIVDLSGTTNEKGEAATGYDPEPDITWLEEEIDYWIKGILDKNWANLERKAKATNKPLWEMVVDQVTGLKITPDRVKDIVNSGYTDMLDLAHKIRTANKPVILAGNKIDIPDAQKNYERLKGKHDITPVTADFELALRKADKAGMIKYVPGSADFTVLKQAEGPLAQALEKIRAVVVKYSGTGVQKVINELVFKKLDYIPVYAVEDETHFSDKKGNVLPDVHLIPRGSNVYDLAARIHTDIAKNMKGALDARTKRKIGKDYVLKENDVVKILV